MIRAYNRLTVQCLNVIVYLLVLFSALLSGCQMTASPDVDVKYVRNTDTPRDGYGAFRIELKTYKGDVSRIKVNLITVEDKELDSQVCRSVYSNCELIFFQERFPAGRHTLFLHKYYYEFDQGRWFHVGQTKISINVGPGYTTHATVDWGSRDYHGIPTAAPSTIEH